MFKKVIGQESGEAHQPSQSRGAERLTPQPRPEREEQVASRAVEESGPTPSVPSSAKSSPVNTRNVLSSDVEIVGTVKFEDDLIVDGKIEGEIQSTGNLTIGENAVIKAEVETGTIMVYGKVHGNLTATDKIELKASSEVVGDIKAKVLMIEAGAIFVGKSTVGTPSQSVGGNSEASRGDAGQKGGQQQPSRKGDQSARQQDKQPSQQGQKPLHQGSGNPQQHGNQARAAGTNK